LKRFAYKVIRPLNEQFVNSSIFVSAILECLPDFYFSDAPSTGNVNFYRSETQEVLNNLYGYVNYDIGITERKLLDSYDSGVIEFNFQAGGDVSFDHIFRIYELAIIYSRAIDIKASIFTPFQGRVFDSTFDTRSATDLIDNPKIALLHLNMLQNWSETGEVASWGKEYPAAPLIDISSNEGGYNFAELSVLDNLKLRRQIFDYRDCMTDVLIDSICRDFFLIPSQDHATGNERISFIGRKYSTAPTETVTLADVIGKISVISSQDEKAIFCEPFVKYNYNTATEKYDGLIQITNSGAETFDASYVIGVTGTVAENLWNKAHKLWIITKKIEPPPEQCTDKNWIYRPEDALWYLDTWLYYMGAVDTETGVDYATRDRLGFDMASEDAETYFKGKHINLVLPFHTENITIECVIEGVTKGQDTTRVEVLLLDNLTEADFYILKTLGTVVASDEVEKAIPEFDDENDWEKVL
jgi:hypothetical protein